MKYTRTLILACLIPTLAFGSIPEIKDQDYEIYHQQVVKAETHIISENYHDALLIYEGLFNDYDFVFLKEYRIATQLALQVGDVQKSIQFLKQGILAGWKLKSIKRNKYLAKVFESKAWKSIKKDYKKNRNQYEESHNKPVKEQVRKMFFKDQWKAIGALFTFSSNAQDRYAEKKFAPQSERQIIEFMKILDAYGYPGEKLIGNDYWMSTILSHHNSISKKYAENDLFYPNVKSNLKQAIKKGEMSPFEYAFIDEWYCSTKSNPSEPSYGYITPLSQSALVQANQLRQDIGLRSIEARNGLVDIQKKTGMNFYLPGNPWVDGEISIK